MNLEISYTCVVLRLRVRAMFINPTIGDQKNYKKSNAASDDAMSYGTRTLDRILNRDLLSATAVAALRKDFQSATPFPHVVLLDLFSSDFLETLNDDFDAVGFGDWLRFNTAQETKRATRANAKLGPSSQLYFDLIHRGFFISFLSAVSGIEGLLPDPTLFGGGLHEIPSGGKFGVHIDFNKHPTTQLDTRLVFITYLNKEWRPSYGGELELWDRAKNACVKKIVPEFGTSILFNNSTHSLHGHPVPVEAPNGRTRRSIAAYYYTNGRPDINDIGYQTTQFHQSLLAGKYGRVLNTAKYCLPPIIVDGLKWAKNLRR